MSDETLTQSTPEASAGAVARAGAATARRPCVWAIAGGKGGVGKSLVASNLALAFARRGKRCVLVDADLGGANLHTLLGVPSPRRTLTHFLTGEVASLAEVVAPSGCANLGLVSGSRALLAMANPNHAKKEKLLRHLLSLEADHVFLDLSAGSAFNVLDFFLAARHGIVVVVPEPTSIENAYHFLKAAFFRSLRNAAREAPVRDAIHRVLEERGRGCVRSPQELIAGVQALDPRAGTALRRAARAFAPQLIVNQARTVEHRRLGHEIRRAARDYLGSEILYLGALERDECVRHAVRERRPVLERFPGCPFSQDLEAIADRLLAWRRGALASPGEAATDAGGASPRAGESGALARHGLPGDRVDAPVEEPVRRAALTGAGPEAAPPVVPPLDLAAPGGYLKRYREALGLPLQQLRRRTRILSLESIENERFAELPPEPYIHGLTLQYARTLGIPEAEAVAASFVARFREARAHTCRAPQVPPPARSPRAPRDEDRSAPPVLPHFG